MNKKFTSRILSMLLAVLMLISILADFLRCGSSALCLDDPL